MAKDFLKGTRDSYDVVVIGSGLAGLMSANILARAGHSVLLLEHHYRLGGMATWFKRQNGHIFDIALHRTDRLEAVRTSPAATPAHPYDEFSTCRTHSPGRSHSLRIAAASNSALGNKSGSSTRRACGPCIDGLEIDRTAPAVAPAHPYDEFSTCRNPSTSHVWLEVAIEQA